MTKKKRQKRGFLVALLVSFDEQAIYLWKIFTHQIREFKQVKLAKKWKNTTDKEKYHLYEDLVNLLRPIIKEGLKSVILANPPKHDYSSEFLEHVKKHHQWLIRLRGSNQVSFGQIVGNASSLDQANALIAEQKSVDVIRETTSVEGDLMINHFEKVINAKDKNAIFLYDLKEIENYVYKIVQEEDSSGGKVDYLILTDNFLDSHAQKNRIHKLMQIAENKGILTRVITGESPAGTRVNQFGGIICFKNP